MRRSLAEEVEGLECCLVSTTRTHLLSNEQLVVCSAALCIPLPYITPTAQHLLSTITSNAHTTLLQLTLTSLLSITTTLRPLALPLASTPTFFFDCIPLLPSAYTAVHSTATIAALRSPTHPSCSYSL